MALRGRKPKPDGEKVNRNAPTHDWVEVADVPYRGPRPRLPAGLPAATRGWWTVVTRLPHAVLWGPGDWQFALDTARVHAAFASGDMARAAELRLRERAMGITTDALRDLRIRLVEQQAEAPKRATVTALATERWRRLTDAG